MLQMSQEVLSNVDLVRKLISHNTRILAASKAIRDAHEPCTPHYEAWSRDGCPSQPTQEERQCLQNIDGYSSALCQGTYKVVLEGKERKMDASEAYRALVRHLHPRGTTLRLVMTLGSNILTVHRAESNIVTLTTDGWRTKGHRCMPNDAELHQMLFSIMSTTGKVPLPCAPTTSVRGPIVVPRRIQIHASRIEPRSETVLYSARRY